MKAKELLELVKTGNMCAWSIGQVNKVPLTNKQNKSLYYMVDGLGKVDTTKLIQATNFKPQGYSITLHFCGAQCKVDGSILWEAFTDKCGKINEAVVRSEGC